MTQERDLKAPKDINSTLDKVRSQCKMLKSKEKRISDKVTYLV